MREILLIYSLLSSSMMLLIASSASRSKIPPSNKAGGCSDSFYYCSRVSSFRIISSSSESSSPLAILCQGCMPPFVWFSTVTLYLLGPWLLTFRLGSPAMPFTFAMGFAVVIFMSIESLWFVESLPSVLSNSDSLPRCISFILTREKEDSCFPLVTFCGVLSWPSVSCEKPRLTIFRREFSTVGCSS